MSSTPIPGTLIPLSRPDLPPLDRFVAGLEEIWAQRILSNGGPMLRALEARFASAFGGMPVSVVANGALALELAFAALEVSGEVITTPFSFAASANAIIRSGCRPVFADVEPRWFTLDPAAVEAAVTADTRAILAVHVFGMPCDLEGLASVARRHGLRLIYDAAHAFEVTINGMSIGAFGDATMFSLHATKPFHAVEGGLLATANSQAKCRVDAAINHGLGPGGIVAAAGTNAKMSELHALLGLLMHDGMEARYDRREAIAACYIARLAGLAGVTLPSAPAPGVRANNSYFVVRIDPSVFGMGLTEIAAAMATLNIVVRRYFYPLLSEMPAFPNDAVVPVATGIAASVLALPMSAALTDDEVDRVCAGLASLVVSR